MSRRLSKRIDKLEKGRDTRRLSNPHLKYWEADLRRHRLQCEVIAGRLLSVADQAELDCLNELLAVEDRERGRLVELSIRELKYGSLRAHPGSLDS
jgi:hypothetical protein